jgi:CBS-domain-containing membrane protein
MKVREVMTEPVLTCSPETSLATAAGLMREADYGTLPVVDVHGRLAGIITHIRRPCATNGVSTLRGDEESACAHKLDDPQLPRKAPVEAKASKEKGVT